MPLASKTDCAKAIAELKVEGPVAPVAYEDDVTGPAERLARARHGVGLGGEAGHVDDLELDPVGVVEEDGVVPGV